MTQEKIKMEDGEDLFQIGIGPLFNGIERNIYSWYDRVNI